MQITTNGIVLRVKPLNEDSRLISLLTAGHGVIHAFAKINRKLGGCMAAPTELFSYASFVLFYHKEKYTIDKAESNRIFFNIRTDLEKLSLASYMAELALELAPENEDSREYLSLFLNCLHLLEEGTRTATFIKSVFELRILTLAGYMPDLVACRSCGQFSGSQVYFLPNTGVIICSNCLEASAGEERLLLSGGELAAMRHIIYSEASKLFQFKMPNEGLTALNAVTERYMHAQLGKTFASLKFYHTVSTL